MSAAATPPDLAGRFASIVEALRHQLAFWAAKDRTFAPLLLILWNRLSRVMARFAAIAARHQAGTLRRPSAKPRRPRTTPTPPPPRDPLPRECGWLWRRAPESIPYANYLRLLLEEPETQALLQAAPQAARLLRPLCRMLGVTPPPDPHRPTRPRGTPHPPARPRSASASPPSSPPSSSPSVPRQRPARARPAAQPVSQGGQWFPAWVPRLGSG